MSSKKKAAGKSTRTAEGPAPRKNGEISISDLLVATIKVRRLRDGELVEGASITFGESVQTTGSSGYCGVILPREGIFPIRIEAAGFTTLVDLVGAGDGAEFEYALSDAAGTVSGVDDTDSAGMLAVDAGRNYALRFISGEGERRLDHMLTGARVKWAWERASALFRACDEKFGSWRDFRGHVEMSVELLSKGKLGLDLEDWQLAVAEALQDPEGKDVADMFVGALIFLHLRDASPPGGDVVEMTDMGFAYEFAVKRDGR